MKDPLPLAVGVFIASLLQVGCAPRSAVQDNPVVEAKQALLAVTIFSTPPQATISLKHRPLGLTPQFISVDNASDLLQLKAVFGESEAREKRIRFLSPERAEVHFLFGKDQSPLAKALGLSKVLVFDYGEGITFDVNRHELKPEFTALLERQAKMLTAYFRDLDIYVCGHTDSSGNPNSNLMLSLARAQTVADFLVARSIPRSRMKVQGFGSDFPLAGNNTVEGKALNRRTEIVLPQ